jgi:hypothetical protein
MWIIERVKLYFAVRQMRKDIASYRKACQEVPTDWRNPVIHSKRCLDHWTRNYLPEKTSRDVRAIYGMLP